MDKGLEQSPKKAVKIKRFFSWLLVGGVRVLLFPLTLVFCILVFLWSLPFRLHDMHRRAKHPFLCQDALRRYLEEQDDSVTFWDLYCCFRNARLSRTVSLFNAHYTRVCERAHRGRAVRRMPRGIPVHPSGWYHSPAPQKPSRLAALRLKVLTALPKIFLYLPSRIKSSFSHFGRAMESSQTAFGSAARFLRRRGAVLLPLALGIFVGVFIANYLTVEPVLEVRVGDKTIGFVESRQTLAEAVRETEQGVSDALGMTFKLSENVSYSFARSANPTYLSRNELVEALSAYTEDYVRVGYALCIDGELVAASENEGTLRRLLEETLETVRKGSENKEISLLSEATVVYQNCPLDAFLSDEELRLLFDEAQSKKDGTVLSLAAYQPKDIPVSKKLSEGEAYCYTISYEHERTAPEELSLVFGADRIEEEVEAIEFNVTYRESDTIYEGTQYIHQKGVSGEKLITYTVYYSGDKEYSREIISEATMTEPTDQIVLIGTKPLPLFSGETGDVTGQKIFIAPVFGNISSYFGLRDMDNDGVLESGHSGIDIPATDGTPLYAAGSGVVLEAGETGNSYGIAVKILHENGLCTYYAHLSAVTVKVGQTVSQNQMIGNVGTTGYVTGAHVHFEVRLPSGVRVNPINYLIGY